MTKHLSINLLVPPWIQFLAGEIRGPYGETQTLKSRFRDELWSNGWRDGQEIKRSAYGAIINYQWEVKE